MMALTKVEESRPQGMVITTPGNWIQIAMSEVADEAHMIELLEQQLAAHPELGEQRETIVDFFRHAAKNLGDVNIEFAASTIEQDGDLLLSATVTVALTELDAQFSPQALKDRLEQGTAREDEQMTLVDLPAGTALRVEKTSLVRVFPAGASVVTLYIQYLLPVPGAMLMAAITFMTPTVGLRGPLTELFDTIAHTFRFTFAGDETEDGEEK